MTKLKGENDMSKFNKAESKNTVNRSGFPAYKMTPKEQLVSAVLTTMFSEPKFYGSTDESIISLAITMAANDPAFLCRLACYARNVGNMRSVSHALAAVIARYAREYTRMTVRNVVARPDDLLEIMSCYKSMFGKPFPNALKREAARVMLSFDEYSLAKYNNKKGAMKLRDVLRITHPVPESPEKAELFRRLMNDELQIPYTWETELSQKGNTKEVWDELIASGRVGYMAMLRNLSNMVRSGADIAPVLRRLSDPEEVRRSRQLPFRFFSAYRTLIENDLMTPEIHWALEIALRCSLDNIEHIPGRTLIAVDSSGSMRYSISRRSTIRCCDIGTLFGAMASHICEDATVCYFDCSRYSNFRNPKGYKIARYGVHDSILDIVDNNSSTGCGTEMSLPMEYALYKDPTRDLKPFDRVIYFSDSECNSFGTGKSTATQMVNEYRSKYNPMLWVHGVDLAGYGTQQFAGPGYNLISGWGESVLSFIMIAEKGIGTLVRTIEQYKPSGFAAQEENI